ncbi:MAG: D-alanine-D-alanine ligase [Chloroflexota bacterium]|jgi:D-alanine-D-alanine ligase|nr:D-alanine-D-alanine ligase [Chloroflexota bacterium]
MRRRGWYSAQQGHSADASRASEYSLPVQIGIAFDARAEDSPPAAGPCDRYEEYDSAATVDAIAAALATNGHTPRLVGGGRRLLEALLADPPDLVFNLAEGFGSRSREAHVPAVCEMLGIPFTHSDPLTLALALDKPLAKRVAQSHGVRTPPFVVVEAIEDLDCASLPPFPLFVKPAAEGSSMGVRRTSRVLDRRALEVEVARCLRDYCEPVLVEAFLPGCEVTAGVVGNGPRARMLGAMEIVPKQVAMAQFVYGLETKRNYLEEVEYHLAPSGLSPAQLADVEATALDAYRALGCRDVARVDLRLDGDGRANLLEINPLPGLSPLTGDLVILARAAGWSYEALIGRIVDEALERLG